MSNVKALSSNEVEAMSNLSNNSRRQIPYLDIVAFGFHLAFEL
jgi:hypothetical protein